MLSVALKRLAHRPLLTLLSIVGVALAVGLMSAISLFAHAISFLMLDQELDALSARSGRPRFPVMIYALPSKDYPLTVREADRLTSKIADTFVDEVGLPLVSVRYQLESDALALGTEDEVTPYGEPHTVIQESMHLVVLPGVESHVEVVDGRAMEQGRPSGDALNVWLYEDTADKMGIEVGETYRYFPTVFEARSNRATIVGNLEYLFKQVGATLMHDIWLQVEAGADRAQIVEDIRARNVYISHWRDARAEIAHEQAQPEHVGVFGLLTVGFLAAALLAGVAFLVYNYASLQERLFRFAILRAVGLSIVQIVGEVAIEYVALLLYGVLGGAATGVWAAHLFIPFFQATDMEVVQPPRLIPLIAWRETGWIAGAFAAVLVVAQLAVIAASVRRGTFQALRLGDQE